MAVSFWQAHMAKKAKTEVEQYAEQISSNIKISRFQKLIEQGMKVKKTLQKYISKGSESSVGFNEEKNIEMAVAFHAEVNENKHLISNSNIESYLFNFRKYLEEKNYRDSFYSVSDIISILNKENDNTFIKNSKNSK